MFSKVGGEALAIKYCDVAFLGKNTFKISDYSGRGTEGLA